MAEMKKKIVFLRYWRGREIGHVTDELDFNVVDQLIQRRIAEPYQEKPKPTQEQDHRESWSGKRRMNK